MLKSCRSVQRGVHEFCTLPLKYVSKQAVVNHKTRNSYESKEIDPYPSCEGLLLHQLQALVVGACLGANPLHPSQGQDDRSRTLRPAPRWCLFHWRVGNASVSSIFTRRDERLCEAGRERRTEQRKRNPRASAEGTSSGPLWALCKTRAIVCWKPR